MTAADIASKYNPIMIGLKSALRLLRSDWATRRTADAQVQSIIENKDTTGGFDETYYLSTYPDVADAIKRGIYRNGLHHYEHRGLIENRSKGPSERPRPDAELRLLKPYHQKSSYLAPQDLRVGKHQVRRTMVLGSCLSASWAEYRSAEMLYAPTY